MILIAASEKKELDEQQQHREDLKSLAWNLKRVPIYAKEEIVKLIEGDKVREDVLKDIQKHMEEWPEPLRLYVDKKIKEL